MRAWVPGCSTGEEAYSLAMVFKEAMAKTKSRKRITLQIFATDLDKDAIDKARQGFYPENICADVSPEQMGRFFKKEERGCRVTNEIREMVIFAPQSLIHGSAVHQARYFVLPQPADLPYGGSAEKTDSAVPLQPQSRRHPVSRQRGDGRELHRLVHPHQ